MDDKFSSYAKVSVGRNPLSTLANPTDNYQIPSPTLSLSYPNSRFANRPSLFARMSF